MDLQQLRTFRSVVSTGSVRAAADVLGYSPSAVSQQVSALQRDTGLSLIARVGRGVEPTHAGRALAERIDGVLAELQGLDEFVRSLREGRSGWFVLGYAPSLSTSWLPSMLGPLTAHFPETRIELFVEDGFNPARQPQPDVQLTILGPQEAVPAGYEQQELATDPYVVALPPGHRLTAFDSVPLAELAGEDWIENETTQGWCRQVVLESCAAAGFQPRFHMQTHDYPTALALVETGLGITVLPSLGALSVPPEVTVRAVVGPSPTRTVSALVRTESADSPMTRMTLDLAHSAARSVPLPPGQM